MVLSEFNWVEVDSLSYPKRSSTADRLHLVLDRENKLNKVVPQSMCSQHAVVCFGICVRDEDLRVEMLLSGYTEVTQCLFPASVHGNVNIWLCHQQHNRTVIATQYRHVSRQQHNIKSTPPPHHLNAIFTTPLPKFHSYPPPVT